MHCRVQSIAHEICSAIECHPIKILLFAPDNTLRDLGPNASKEFICIANPCGKLGHQLSQIATGSFESRATTMDAT
eukprot:scaffold587879_cov22-Prasinocladus_malaysianus.AAC.1